MKIPEVKLPEFSGAYERWPEFCDAFKSSIHRIGILADDEKLTYLRSCLIGKAAEKIESLEITVKNYSVAWAILEREYNDPHAIMHKRIQAWYEIEGCAENSSKGFDKLADEVTKNYRALQALGRPFIEAFPIYWVVSKMDSKSRLKWKECCRGGSASPTMEQLLDFLYNRKKILESYTFTVNSNAERRMPRDVRVAEAKVHRGTRVRNETRAFASRTESACVICKGIHNIHACDTLAGMTLDRRVETVRKAALCYNCLRPNHMAEACRSKPCQICKRKHHFLLHKEVAATAPDNERSVGLSATTCPQVLLSTAIVKMTDSHGREHKCRVLLDSGSQSNFISDAFATKLGIQRDSVEIPISGINEINLSAKQSISTRIASCTSEYVANTKFLILQQITSWLPSKYISKEILELPVNIRLADPNFNKPARIDALIGAEIFYSLLCSGQIKSKSRGAILQKTRLGWVVSGRIEDHQNNIGTVCNVALRELDTQLKKFWEIEEGSNEPLLSPEELTCEALYAENTVRASPMGRYTVRLPFRQNKDTLGMSFNNALKRYIKLERSLERDPTRQGQYTQFMREYLALGHMSEVAKPNIKSGFYLPHHAVIKDASATTKLRVVFDASAKSSSGVSLNDTLMVGPTVQDDLISIVLRFRSHPYVMTADIEKMYRQVELHKDDREYQKILWRDNPWEEIKTYELNTVTYGTAAASYLATRTLRQLAIDERETYPKAACALERDFYVDDLLAGASSLGEAVLLRDQLIAATQKGGFNLRQWESNAPELIDAVSERAGEAVVQLGPKEARKTLGILWNARDDSIGYSYDVIKKVTKSARLTKRIILSEIAQLFDPLGLLDPIITKAKLIMQGLWRMNIQWDESVPSDMRAAWTELKLQLATLHDFRVERQIIIDDRVSVELHGFSDASERAYGACLYARSTDREGRILIRLICAKSKVAPLKTQSLPRLELCAAVLLSKLVETAKGAFRGLTWNRVILWSDSTIVLHWLRTLPHTLKTFVAHRVTEIQRITSKYEWRHVRSEDNPADLISRGLMPQELIHSQIWHRGPAWLKDQESNWPKTDLSTVIEIPETRPLVALVTTKLEDEVLQRFSSMDKLTRVVAYCIRFIKNAKCKERGNYSQLVVSELRYARNAILKIVQRETFDRELSDLRTGKLTTGQSKCVSPFIDGEGLIRVGGRLRNAKMTFGEKHPVLLPRQHHVTKLIIRQTHERHMHAGTEATLCAIRKTCWVIRGREAVKSEIRKCVACYRANPRRPNLPMGNLPGSRVNFERPFIRSGVDFCGPFLIKEKTHRNRNK